MSKKMLHTDTCTCPGCNRFKARNNMILLEALFLAVLHAPLPERFVRQGRVIIKQTDDLLADY